MCNNRKTDRTSNFMKLLVANQARIFVYILSLVPRKNDAEDVLQETLTEMWNKFDDYTEGTNFSAWGTTIARYKVFNYRKKHWNNDVIFDERLAEMIEEKVEQKLGVATDYFTALKSCAEKLSSRDAELLKMRYEEGMTCKNIGKIFGITHQGVSKAMARIHAILLRCIRMTLRAQESAL